MIDIRRKSILTEVCVQLLLRSDKENRLGHKILILNIVLLISQRQLNLGKF